MHNRKRTWNRFARLFGGPTPTTCIAALRSLLSSRAISPVQIRLRIIFMSVTLLLAGAAGFAALLFAARPDRLDAALINRAGKQRMLSQQIARSMLAAEVAFLRKEAQDIHSVRNALENARHEWNLLRQAAALKRPENEVLVEAWRLAVPRAENLHRNVERYILLASQNTSGAERRNAADRIQASVDEFAQEMDEIAGIYEGESVLQRQRSNWDTGARTGVLILCWGALSLVLLKPLFKQLRHSDESLHKAHRELRHLQHAIDNSLDAVLLVDAKGSILYVNHAFARLSGYSREEALGKNPRILKSGEQDASWYKGMWQSLLSVGYWQGDLVDKRKNGQHYTAHLTIAAFRDELGRLSGYIGIQRDVTEERKLRKDLSEARDAAEYALRSRTDFLAVMSHEIRTPLTTLVAVADLLKTADPNPEHLRAIHSAAHNLLSIVNNMIDFTKAERGASRLSVAPFSLHALLQGIHHLALPLARHKEIQFNADHADLPDRVSGDEARLRQILVNVVMNAIKFTDRGEVRLTARGNGQTVRFEIADTGCGIEPGSEAQIFEPFVQADSSAARRYEGSGLGLAISRQIVELMGGEIGAKRRETGGSLFWIELPLTADTSPAETQFQQPTMLLAGRRILLIEDNEINGKLLEKMLENMGARVQWVLDGEGGLELFHRESVDLILTDIHLPGQDGFEICAKVRAFEELQGRRRTPVIALSADPFVDGGKRALGAGIDRWIIKPVTMDTLTEALQRWSMPLDSTDGRCGA